MLHHLAPSRFDFPGKAFESCRAVTIPSFFPAYNGGNEVNPPIPTTTWAPRSRSIFRDCRIVFQSFHRKGSILIEKVGGFAIAATVANSNAPYFAEASASTFFCDINRSG